MLIYFASFFLRNFRGVQTVRNRSATSSSIRFFTSSLP